MSDYIERLDQRRQRREAAAAAAAADAAAEQQEQEKFARYSPEQKKCRASSPPSNAYLFDSHAKRRAGAATVPQSAAPTSHASAAAGIAVAAFEGRPLSAAAGAYSPRETWQQQRSQCPQQQMKDWREEQQSTFQEQQQHLPKKVYQPQSEQISEQKQQQKADKFVAAAMELRQQARLSEEKARCLPRGRQRELLLSFAAAKQQRAEEFLQQQTAAAGEQARREEYSQRGPSAATNAAATLQVTNAAVEGRLATESAAARSPHAGGGDNGYSSMNRSVFAAAESGSCSTTRPNSRSEELTYSFPQSGNTSRPRGSDKEAVATAESRNHGTDEDSRRMFLMQQQVQELREAAAQQRDKAVLVRGSKQRSLVLVAEKKEREVEQLLQRIHACQQKMEEDRGLPPPHSRNGNVGNKEREQTYSAAAGAPEVLKQQPSQAAAAAGCLSASSVSMTGAPAAAAAVDEYERHGRSSYRSQRDPQPQQTQERLQQQQQQQRHLMQQWQQERAQIEHHQQQHWGGEARGDAVAKLRMEAAVARDKASCCSGAKARQLRSLAELKDRQADERLRLLDSPLPPPSRHAGTPPPVGFPADNPVASPSSHTRSADVAFHGTARESAAVAVAPVIVSGAPASVHSRHEAGTTSRSRQVAAAVEKHLYRADAAVVSQSSSIYAGSAASCYQTSDAALHSRSSLPPLPAAAAAEAAADAGTMMSLNAERRLLLQRVLLLREEADQNRAKASYLSEGRQRQLLAIAAAKERQALEIEEHIRSSAAAADSAAAIFPHPAATAPSRSDHPVSAAASATTTPPTMPAAAASFSTTPLLQQGSQIQLPAARGRSCTLQGEQQQPPQQKERGGVEMEEDGEEEEKEVQRQMILYQLLQQQNQQRLQQQYFYRKEKSRGGMGNRMLLQQMEEEEHVLPPHLQPLPSSVNSSIHPACVGDHQQQQQHLMLQQQQDGRQQQYRDRAENDFLEQQKQLHVFEERRKMEQQQKIEMQKRRMSEEEEEGGRRHSTNSSSRFRKDSGLNINSWCEQEDDVSSWHCEKMEDSGELREGPPRETLGQLQQLQQQLQQKLQMVEEQLMLHQPKRGAAHETRLLHFLQQRKGDCREQQQQRGTHHPQQQHVYDVAQQQIEEEQQLRRQQQRSVQQQDSRKDKRQYDEAQTIKERPQLSVMEQGPVQQHRQQETYLMSRRGLREDFTIASNSSNSSRNSSSRGSLKSDVFHLCQSPRTNGEAPRDQQKIQAQKPLVDDAAASASNSRNTLPGSNVRVGSRSSTATSIGIGSEF